MRIINCFECTTVVTIMKNMFGSNTGGLILNIHMWDVMFAREEYFCSFVTKSNQICTKYLLKCIQQFLYDRQTWRVPRNFYKAPSPRLKRWFCPSHCKTFSSCRLPVFSWFFKINKIRPPVYPISSFWQNSHIEHALPRNDLGPPRWISVV